MNTSLNVGNFQNFTKVNANTGKAESVLRLSSESVLRLSSESESVLRLSSESESVLRLSSESVLRVFRVRNLSYGKLDSIEMSI